MFHSSFHHSTISILILLNLIQLNFSLFCYLFSGTNAKYATQRFCIVAWFIQRWTIAINIECVGIAASSTWIVSLWVARLWFGPTHAYPTRCCFQIAGWVQALLGHKSTDRHWNKVSGVCLAFLRHLKCLHLNVKHRSDFFITICVYYWRANSNKSGARTNQQITIENANPCCVSTANVITYISRVDFGLIAFYYFKQKTVAFIRSANMYRINEKKKSFVLLLLVFSPIVCDIIKDPLILSNAVAADVQADVFPKRNQQNERKRERERSEKKRMHFIYVPWAFNEQTPASGFFFFVFCSWFALFCFIFLLSKWICPSLIASSYDCFCSTQATRTLLFFFVIWASSASV